MFGSSLRLPYLRRTRLATILVQPVEYPTVVVGRLDNCNLADLLDASVPMASLAGSGEVGTDGFAHQY